MKIVDWTTQAVKKSHAYYSSGSCVISIETKGFKCLIWEYRILKIRGRQECQGKTKVIVFIAIETKLVIYFFMLIITSDLRFVPWWFLRLFVGIWSLVVLDVYLRHWVMMQVGVSTEFYLHIYQTTRRHMLAVIYLSFILHVNFLYYE